MFAVLNSAQNLSIVLLSSNLTVTDSVSMQSFFCVKMTLLDRQEKVKFSRKQISSLGTELNL